MLSASTTTHDAYLGVPLANLSAAARGNYLETVARRVIEQRAGARATNPCFARRGKAPYDFVLQGRRVEIKSAQIQFKECEARWRAHWRGIKREAHDDLYLVLYSPSGLRIYSGRSDGTAVYMDGYRKQCSISAATDVICSKLDARLTLVSDISFDALDAIAPLETAETVTHRAYVGVPLASLSAAARGKHLEVVARRLLEKSTGSRAEDPPIDIAVKGARRRGKNQAPYDFILKGRRVEIKSAQVTYNFSNDYWRALWRSVKRDAHDDLYLVLYSPSGLRVYRHDGAFGICRPSESSRGECVCVTAHKKSIHAALDVICSKLDASLELVCHVNFDGGARSTLAPDI